MTLRFSPPVRFAVMTLAIWTGGRIAYVSWPAATTLQATSPGLEQDIPLDATRARTRTVLAPTVNAGISPSAHAAPQRFATVVFPSGRRIEDPRKTPFFSSARRPLPSPHFPVANRPAGQRLPGGNRQPQVAMPILPEQPASPGAVVENRFVLSTWALWRRDTGNASLAPGGRLGASQAGLRARYRLTSARQTDIGLYSRLSRPLEGAGGSEGAVGISIRPHRRLAVELIAERRIALDHGGRNAWAVGVAGGVSRQRLPLDFELDAYAQAGIVGLNNRDGYAEAAVDIGRQVFRRGDVTVSLGMGGWAGIQPGAKRADIGPQAVVRLPIGDGGARATIGWRHRIAGDASPGSGPAISIGTDF